MEHASQLRAIREQEEEYSSLGTCFIPPYMRLDMMSMPSGIAISAKQQQSAKQRPVCFRCHKRQHLRWPKASPIIHTKGV
mmetsp:Transcript_20015/g.29668  ORF Transcript_20015/g.29668 Transcript_20015/m.29668 type:complete len:80 (-) Transcript_20015:425-664(-)